MKYYSIHQFSKLICRTPQTLRNWDKSGKLKPHHTGANGYRYYSHDQLNELLQNNQEEKQIIGYCRVSNTKQKDKLPERIQYINAYLDTNFTENIVTVLFDIGSGTNYKNKNLQKIIEMICNNEVSKLVILSKENLVTYGFDLIEKVASINEVEIIVLNEKDMLNIIGDTYD